ncbi:MAG: zinc-binding dehydrogenase [Candidatus Binatia bacterium]
MQQAQLFGPHDIRLVDVPPPECGPDDVIVQVHACGICGTDLGFVNAGGLDGPTAAPMALGHEFAGTLRAVGANVRDLPLGARVVVNPISGFNFIGNGGPQGAFASLVAVRNIQAEPTVYPLPANVPIEHAALVEPLAVAFHAVRQGGVTAASRVVVFGAGPIGLGTVLALAHRGVDHIVVVDPSRQRLDTAQRLGAHLVCAPDAPDLWDVVRARHGEAAFYGMPMPGTDVFIDCAGVAAVVQTVIAQARPGARLVLVGVCKGEVPLDLRMVLAKELQVVGSMGYPEGFGEVIEFLATTTVDVSAMISHRFPLSRIAEAIATASNPTIAAKVLVLPER